MELYVPKSLDLFVLLLWVAVVARVVHAVVPWATSVSCCSHFLIDMNFFHENEAFLLSQTGTASAQPYQRENLIIPENRSYLSILVLIRVSTQEKSFNHMLLEVFVQGLIRNLFSELDNHFSSNEFKHLINPE